MGSGKRLGAVGAVVCFAIATSGTRGALAAPAHVVTLHNPFGSYDPVVRAAKVPLAQAFFGSHADVYDFLVVFTDIPVDFGEEGVQGLYTPIRNDVGGIGAPLFDDTGIFGSGGRLQGIIDMGPTAVDLSSSSAALRERLAALTHEVAHRFVAYPTYLDASGATRNDLLGRQSAHWSFFVDSDGSLMYGADWRNNGDGSFTSAAIRHRFSMLDLYLMGFASADEVGPITIIDPIPLTPYATTDLPVLNATIWGTARTVTTDQIVAAMGPRQPPAERSPRELRAGFVFYHASPAPSAAMLESIDLLRRQFVSEFFFLTRGRALVDTDLIEVPPAATADEPGIHLALAFLEETQKPNGAWSDDARTAVEDTALAVQALTAFGRSGVARDAGVSWLTDMLRVGANTDTAARARGLETIKQAGVVIEGAVQTLVAQSAELGGGFGALGLYRPEARTTALAAHALQRLGLQPGVADELALRSLQNDDGGFGFVAGGPSRVQPTALVTLALIETFGLVPAEPIIQDAIAFLHARRQPGGGFGDEIDDVLSTALAGRALLRAGALSGASLDSAVSYLFDSQRPNGSWDDLVAPSAEALLFLRHALSPNLVLVSMQSSEADPPEGTVVSIRATVRNAGYAASRETMVRLVDNQGGIVAEIPLAAMSAGGSVTVTLALDTEGRPGAQELYIIVDPLGIVDESNEIDNQGLLTLMVRPRPDQPDLRVVASAISREPLDIVSLPVLATFTVQVQNVGRQDVALTTLALLENGVVLDEQPMSVLGASSTTIRLQTTITTGGPQRFEIVADRGDVVDEFDETNNSAVVPVVPEPTFDLVVTSLAAIPAEIDIGTDVQVRARVANRGTLAATSVFELLVQTAGGPKRIASRSVSLAAGAIADLDLSWRPNSSGSPLILMGRVDPDNTLAERDETNNETQASLVVRPSTLANLEVTADGIHIEPQPPLEGASAAVRVAVTNTGFADSSPVALRLTLGSPTGPEIAQAEAPSLAPGATATVPLEWHVDARGDVLLYAVIDPAAVLDEFDEQDNIAFVPLHVQSLPDLVVDVGDIAFAPAVPREGESVQIQITVRNLGEQTAKGVTVSLHRADGPTLGDIVLGAVAGHGSATGQLNWNTTGLAGEVEVVALVDATGAVPEQNENNNQASRSLRLQNRDLYADNPIFSPNGDGVKDTATVTYRTSLTIPVRIDVTDQQGTQRVVLSTEAPPDGAITWDGRDGEGKLLRDDPYTLRILGPEGQVVGAINVTIDTDRSRIYDVLPAGVDTYVVDLVDFAVVDGSISSSRFLANDQHVLHRSDYREPIGSIRLFNLTAESWIPADTLASTIFTPSNVDDRIASVSYQRDLVIYDARTGETATLVAKSDRVEFPSYDISSPVWIQSGRVLLAQARWCAIPPCTSSEWILSVVAVNSMTGDIWRVAPGDDPETQYVDALRFNTDPTGTTVVWCDWEGNLFITDLYGTSQRPLNLRAAGSYLGQPLDHFAMDTHGSTLAYFSSLELEDRSCVSELRAVDLIDGSVRLLDRIATPAYDSSGGGEGQLQCPWHYGTDQFDVQWSPDGQWLLYTAGLLDIPGTERVGLIKHNGSQRFDITDKLPFDLNLDALYFDAYSPFLDAQWSPQQKHLLLGSSKVVSSFHNLTSRLRVFRAPGAHVLNIVATAEDLHFDNYSVEAFRADAPGVPISIARNRRVPARNETIAVWAPPAPGNYDLIITARDVAGNVLSQRKTVTFSDTPLVTALSVEPQLVSPNGDGILDRATVSYRVNAPANLLFEIANTSGTAVRSIARSDSEPGSYSFSWDGLDDSGALVTDGTYTIRSDNQLATVTLDMTPPAVTLAFEGPMMIPERHELFYALKGSVQDPHLKTDDLLLEIVTQNIPATVVKTQEALGIFADGVVTRPKIQDVDDFHFRLRANDFAGNGTIVYAPPPEEELFAFRYWSDPQFDPAGNPQPVGSTLLLAPAPDGFAEVARVQFYGEKPVLISLVDSIRLPLVDVYIEAQDAVSPDGIIVIEPLWLEPETGFVLWDPISLQPAVAEVRVIATDNDGVIYTSNRVFMARRSYIGPICTPRLDILSESALHMLTAAVQAPVLTSIQSASIRMTSIDGKSVTAPVNVFDCRADVTDYWQLKGCELLREAERPERFLIIWDGSLAPACEFAVELELVESTGLRHIVHASDIQNNERVIQGCRILLEGSASNVTHVEMIETYPHGPAIDAVITACSPSLGCLEQPLMPFDGHNYGAIFNEGDRSKLKCGMSWELAARRRGLTMQDMDSQLCQGETITITPPCFDLGVTATRFGEAAACGDTPSPRYHLTLGAKNSVDRDLKSVEWALRAPDGVETPLGYYDVSEIDRVIRDSREFLGSELAEGTWTVAALASGRSGAKRQRLSTFIIDRTLPIVDLQAPADREAVCAKAKRMNGIARRVIPISGNLEDLHLESYAILFSPGEVSEADDQIVLGWQSQQPEPVNTSGLLAEWDVTDLPAGLYTLTLSGIDTGLNRRCKTIVVDLDGEVSLNAGTPYPKLISPNADGIDDATTVFMHTTESVRMYAAVRAANGVIATVLLDNAEVEPGDTSLTWSGIDSAFNVVPDGRYTLETRVTDHCENVTTRWVDVEIDATPPLVLFTSPVEWSVVGGPVEIRGTASDPHFSWYRLTAVPQGATHGEVLAVGNQALTDQVLASWSTGSLPPGGYTLRLEAADAAGNVALVERTVSVRQTDLIGGLVVTPPVFSPNADGTTDVANLSIHLLHEANVVVTIVDSSGATVRVLVEQPLSAGAHLFVWDGTSTTAVVVPDGAYDVLVSANGAGVNDVAVGSVIIDTRPPLLAVDAPVPLDVLGQPASVRGSIQDEHLALASVLVGPSSAELATVNERRTPQTGELAVLTGLAEGDYILRLQAVDVAGNAASHDIDFTIDLTPPAVGLTSPEDAAHLGIAITQVPARAAITDAHLGTWRLEFGDGEAPASWLLIADGSQVPADGLLAAWDTSSISDGTKSLRLTAVDQANNTARHDITVVIDHTAPVAVIAGPAEGQYVTAPLAVTGSATDDNFASYQLAFVSAASGGAPAVLREEVARPQNGVLGTLDPLPPDGSYQLRLRVIDRAGNESVDELHFTIDTTPPAAPPGVTAVAAGTAVEVTWLPSPSPDVVAYRVWRKDASGLRVELTAAPQPEFQLVDVDMPDGTYMYEVIAQDAAGLESAPAISKSVHIDRTPPLARLLAPRDGARVRGMVEVVGTATSDADDLQDWRLLVARDGQPGSLVVVRSSGQPIVAQTLGSVDTALLPDDAGVLIRLEATDLAGNTVSDEALVTVDNAPPAAVALLQATPSSPWSGAPKDRVVLAWTQATEPDVAGYALVRNDELFGKPGLERIEHILISDTQHTDGPLVDRSYTYTILVVDTAGNRSIPSNSLVAQIETGAPSAFITSPEAGAVLTEPTTVSAEITNGDQDIAHVQFEIRGAGSSTFASLGAPDAVAPYVVTLDPTALTPGEYLLRAVVMDLGGRVDPSPPTIVVRIDRTPAAPADLLAHVEGDTVTLTWTAATPEPPGGYRLHRTDLDVDISATAITYTDSQVPEGEHVYELVAMGLYGAMSTPVLMPARVYRPRLSGPTPSGLDLYLEGANATPGAVVSLTEDGDELAQVIAGADGSFIFDLSFAPAGHWLTAVATDVAGNASLPATFFADTYDIAAVASAVPVGGADSCAQVRISAT